MLSAAELSRYSRQLILPELGIAGQHRLAASRVLVVGAGGLGSPAALYLAAAGVGTIGIVDNDVVEVSNLHRQIIHTTADVGREKTHSASDAVRRLNPEIRVNSHQLRLNRAEARSLFADYELVVDGSDNYPTRYIVNDTCAELSVTWVYGSVERYSGQVSVFGAPDGPCYRCVFPEAPERGATASCEEIGVLGAVPGIVGALQATEALKLITGIGEPLVGRMLQLDAGRAQFHEIALARRPGCPSCESRGTAMMSFETKRDDDVAFDIEPAELASRLARSESVELLDIREPWEWSIAVIGPARRLPIGQLEDQVDSLDRARELIVYCHHGARSAVAAEWLRAHGFRARNLAGGIDRWSREIDQGMQRY